MSTVSKLNPAVREARSMRAAMVRQARVAHAELQRRHGLGSREEFQGFVIADLLERVARSPYRTGAAKNRIFRRVARELAGAVGR